MKKPQYEIYKQKLDIFYFSFDYSDPGLVKIMEAYFPHNYLTNHLTLK